MSSNLSRGQLLIQNDLTRHGIAFLFVPVHEHDGSPHSGETQANQQTEAVDDQSPHGIQRKKLADAIAHVFSPKSCIEMDGTACENCGKAVHATGHCPVASDRSDTAVDSFCNAKCDAGHPLDSEVMFDDAGQTIGCPMLVEHFEMGRL